MKFTSIKTLVTTTLIAQCVVLSLSATALAQNRWQASVSYHRPSSGYIQVGHGGVHPRPTAIVVLPGVVNGYYGYPSYNGYYGYNGYASGYNLPGFTRGYGGGYDMFAPQPVFANPINQADYAQDEDEDENILESGDVLVGKIKNVPIYSQPNKKSKILYRMKSGTEVVFTGRESDGFLQVLGDTTEGWVDKLLVTFAP